MAWLFAYDDYDHNSTRAFGSPICRTRIHDTALQKYWLLACNTHPDYSIIHNSTGEFLTFKGWLYVPKIFGTNYSVLISWCPRTFWLAADIVDDLRIILLAMYDWCHTTCIAKSVNNASYSKQIHGNWQDCTSHWKYQKHRGNKSTSTLWWNFQNTKGMGLSWCT